MHNETPNEVVFMFPTRGLHVLVMNWCGKTKMMISASLAVSTTSGTATTFKGSLWPGKYLTFSWSVFMMSVSLRPFIISSYTYILIVFSNFGLLTTLLPTILAMVEPLYTKNLLFQNDQVPIVSLGWYSDIKHIVVVRLKISSFGKFQLLLKLALIFLHFNNTSAYFFLTWTIDNASFGHSFL